jgi:hypothetical protein
MVSEKAAINMARAAMPCAGSLAIYFLWHFFAGAGIGTRVDVSNRDRRRFR